MRFQLSIGSRTKQFILFVAVALLLAIIPTSVSAEGNDWIGYGESYNGYTYTSNTHHYQNSYSYGINGWGAYSVHYHYRYPYYGQRNPYFLQSAVIYNPYPYTYGGAFR